MFDLSEIENLIDNAIQSRNQYTNLYKDLDSHREELKNLLVTHSRRMSDPSQFEEDTLVPFLQKLIEENSLRPINSLNKKILKTADALNNENVFLAIKKYITQMNDASLTFFLLIYNQLSETQKSLLSTEACEEIFACLVEKKALISKAGKESIHMACYLFTSNYAYHRNEIKRYLGLYLEKAELLIASPILEEVQLYANHHINREMAFQKFIDFLYNTELNQSEESTNQKIKSFQQDIIDVKNRASRLSKKIGCDAKFENLSYQSFSLLLAIQYAEPKKPNYMPNYFKPQRFNYKKIYSYLIKENAELEKETFKVVCVIFSFFKKFIAFYDSDGANLLRLLIKNREVLTDERLQRSYNSLIKSGDIDHYKILENLAMALLNDDDKFKASNKVEAFLSCFNPTSLRKP